MCLRPLFRRDIVTATLSLKNAHKAVRKERRATPPGRLCEATENGETFSRFRLLILSPAQVVLVNQVTTKVVGQNQSKLVPALGTFSTAFLFIIRNHQYRSFIYNICLYCILIILRSVLK